MRCLDDDDCHLYTRTHCYLITLVDVYAIHITVNDRLVLSVLQAFSTDTDCG